MHPDWADICAKIAQVTAVVGQVSGVQAVAGGCINTAYRFDYAGSRYFIKTHSATRLHMFEAEQAGLAAIRATHSIYAPRPICSGVSQAVAYLVLEGLVFAVGNDNSADRLGRELAEMHRSNRPQFGWTLDNTIGSSMQCNTPMDDWIGFWRQHRLGFQLALAASNGYGGRLQQAGELLLSHVGDFFSGPVQASLLHGDLWSGNYGITLDGRPVIFDPAVYYGDREADIAMTELFGGFPARFYSAYQAAYPLDSGYATRKNLYNLYHILNHLNLFGAAYLGQAQHMIDALLSQVH